ncbi:hypothetical protein GCM10017083_38150 [Thalassobaculum fulvum]|uniref:MFS transporter n=1 Tax=Thalassobaculum fulvum TaxID=1633335 RepID=A0A919CRD5_9PROT|nr:MFS transporter [Thalassobaculum fulvum]GHD57123.1 hypothetical protein GCM10017083_38150 [Thalassobaculum fulvum]
MTSDSGSRGLGRVVATMRHPTFAAMWLAMFFSTVGSSTLLLAIAIRIYLDTGSALNASLVYAAQWLAPIFLAPLIVRLFGAVSPRAALVGCETVGIGLAVAIGWCASFGIVLLLPLLVVRGVIDVAVKSGRLVALKASFEGDQLKSATSLNGTPYVIGLASAGLLASVLVPHLSIASIATLSSGCFAIAAVAYRFLGGRAAAAPDRSASGPRPSLRDLRPALAGDPRLGRRLVLYLLVVATMQGYHTIARTVFPIAGLGLDASGPAWLQAVAIGGVLAGSILAAVCVGRRAYDDARVELVAVLAYGLMLATWLPQPAVLAYAVYFLFMLTYEIAFLRLAGDIMAACRVEHAPSISVAMTIYSLGGMTLVTLAGGWLATAAGLWWTCAAVAAGGLAVLLVLGWQRDTRPGAEPAAE